MQKKPIVGEGHCGLTVTLNIADQYEITHLVDRLVKYYEQRDAYLAWTQKRGSLNWEERKTWEQENPRPEEPVFAHEELEKAFVFLRKLALDKSSKATVFELEEETAE
jgi:phosphatidylserine/phosphatidylglycerophosphate/cardiolipin synthase-like enzyme